MGETLATYPSSSNPDKVYNIILGADGVTYCVKPETIILGDNCAIKDVAHKAIDGIGNLSDILGKFSKQFDGQMVTIKASGLLPVETTDQHLIHVARRTKTCPHCMKKKGIKDPPSWKVGPPEWKEARKIDKGDCLLVPILKPQDVQTRFVLESNRTEWKNRGRIVLDTSDPEVGEILGWYLAEGSGYELEGTITFDLNELDKENIERLSGLIKSKLGRSVCYTNKDGCVRVKITSKSLARWFHENFGQNALQKRIPDFLMFHPQENVLRAFIKAYFLGDGNVRTETTKKKFTTIVFSTVSKVLALQIQLLLARLGAWANIVEVAPRPYNIKGRTGIGKALYQIVSSDRKAFEIVGVPYQEREREFLKIKRDSNYVYLPVRKTESKRYTGEVWDITTTAHSFLASNAVIHNCDCPGWRNRKMCKHLTDYEANGGKVTSPPPQTVKKSSPPAAAKQASVPALPAMPKDGPMFSGKIDPVAFQSELFQSQPWYQGCGGEAEGTMDDLRAFLDKAEKTGWPAEPKMDGINITCFSDGQKNRFWSRNCLEKPYGLSELPLPAGTILIGELGFGSEHALQRRAEYGYDFMDVFGILAAKYESLLDLNDAQMRVRLEQFMANLDATQRKHFKLVPRFYKNLVKEFDAQHEGLVVKKPSVYRGRGSKISEWVKVKKWAEVEMVILSMTLSKATTKTGIPMVESVTCGQYVDGELKPLVKVGAMSSKWSQEFAANFPAYKGKVIKIAHFGRFASGSCRHPSMVDLRDDKSPMECVFKEEK